MFTIHPRRRFISLALAASALAWAPGARAQSETLFQSIGADTARSFAQLSLPGATGIDFRFFGAFAPSYPDTESHVVVIVFEWGPSATGPWMASPDNVKSVPGGMTTFFDTHVYHGPEDAPWVQIHFYAGGLMTASGTFEHASVVPQPASITLWALGLGALALRRRVILGTQGTQGTQGTAS